MFEPLSALAVLGFATGTLGFIVSTISKVDEKVQDFRECKSRLRSFKWQLADACMHLRVWHLIWIGTKPFPDETYVHFWGINGLEDIQTRIDGITELSEQIKNLLHQPVNCETGSSLPRSELIDWHRIIDRDVAGLPSWYEADHNRVGLVSKIGFALFRNAALLEKIGRLKSHIEGLRDFTQYTFRLKQQCDPNKKVEPAELRRISDLKIFIDRISNFGSLVYNNGILSSRLEWAIELGPPGAGHALDLWSEVDRMYIDFIIRDTAHGVQTNAMRVRLYVEEQLAHIYDGLPIVTRRVEQVVLGHGLCEPHSEYDRFFEILPMPVRRSRPLRKMLTGNLFSAEHRKSFKLERADLVYGLGHWMVLLWNTPWSYSLCTCGIRCTLLADICTRHSFLSCPDRFHWYPQCHPPTLTGDRLRLLGVALAEIALAVPIRVILEQEDIIFIIGEESASRKGLLIMLREKFGRNNIAKAVSYCLDPDSANLGMLRPDHLEQYCQNIVLP